MKFLFKLVAIGLCSAGTLLHSSAHTAASILHTQEDYSIIDHTLAVAPQDGADCGLHAIKNAVALFQYLTHTIDIDERNRQLQSDQFAQVGSMSTCREIINVPTGNIYPEELLILVKRAPAYNELHENNKLLILDNLLRPDVARTRKQDKQLAEIIKYMNNGTPFVHALVLGSMNQGIQQSGHWIAAVLERNELNAPIRLHTANSSASFVHDDIDIRQAVQEFDRITGQQLMQFLTFDLGSRPSILDTELAARALQIELDAEYARSLANQ